MSPTDPNRNGNRHLSVVQEGAPASAVSQAPVSEQTSNVAGERIEPETATAIKFATRADAKAPQGMSKAKVALGRCRIARSSALLYLHGGRGKVCAGRHKDLRGVHQTRADLRRASPDDTWNSVAFHIDLHRS